jgi:hypothetical protein
MRDDTRLPPGHQPYDPINSFRVGAFAGALAGAIPGLLAGAGVAWVALLGAVVGGVAGVIYARSHSC